MIKKTNSQWVARLGAGVVALIALSVSAQELHFPDAHVELPQLSATPLRVGHRFPIQDLASIKVGTSAETVRNLLGQPDSLDQHKGAEGWEYDISFPIAGGSSEIVCQFMVLIDSEGRVSSTHWRRPVCADRAQAVLAAPAHTGPAAPAVKVLAPG
ncbi:Outer membrane protein A precursor [Thauera humireducens]|uniref:hypothetical protein n=1 Tax=Thauera humireducens TaxID=1134435 RepID=UPI002467A793|nr:hypothetical protein [Thauera humireducens]CAH1746309.1 Outer membrane protein A precursor [Thauera humireducens]